jgi:hypothetical protein
MKKLRDNSEFLYENDFEGSQEEETDFDDFEPRKKRSAPFAPSIEPKKLERRKTLQSNQNMNFLIGNYGVGVFPVFFFWYSSILLFYDVSLVNIYRPIECTKK